MQSYFKVHGPREASRNLILTLVSMQVNHYITICLKYEKNEDFMNGWLNRSHERIGIYTTYFNGK